jgi:hypothetical protein
MFQNRSSSESEKKNKISFENDLTDKIYEDFSASSSSSSKSSSSDEDDFKNNDETDSKLYKSNKNK